MPTTSPARDTIWTIETLDDVVVLRSSTADEPQPDDWLARLRSALDTLPSVVAVGAKRLDANGRLFAMGEMIVHPKGFHHVGQGVMPQAYRFPEEADAIAGGVVVVDREAFEAAGGISLMQGELAGIELGLRLRQNGGRCVVLPQVVVTDACTPAPDEAEAESFRGRWGFDWLAADLDAVREHHAGTGLLWQYRFHVGGITFDKYVDRPAMHWTSYQRVDVYRQRADHLAGLVKRVCPAGGTAVDLGCGDGLFTHLFARHGVTAIGVDPEAIAIDQARQAVAKQDYVGRPPRFEVGMGESLPFEDESVDVVAMLDVIEHLPNPVVVLREVGRVIKPGGSLIISTPAWQYGGWSDPIYHVCEYSMAELTRQVQAAAPFTVSDTGMIKGTYRDLIVIARRD